MNKTKIAVGVVVALGVVWTGAAWLTGKQIESHMDQIVQNANAQLNKLAPDSRLKVSYQNYQRGLFSSRTQLVVQASSQTEDNALLKPGQSVVLNETIDHGPFPFAQLKKFNLIPSMASVHSELENTPALKKLFDLTKGQSVIDADTRIGYSGATASAIRLLPLDYQNSETGERYAWNGGTLGIDSDAEGDRVNFDSDIDSVALTVRNEANLPVLFTLNGMRLNGKTWLSPQGVRIGDQHFNLKKLTTAVNGQEAATLEGMDIKTAFDSSGNTVSGQIDYAIDNVTLEKHSFGSGKMTLKLSQFDGQALKTASDNYRSQMQALINQPGIEQDPVRYQEGVRQILAANLPLVLKGDPVVTIAPLSWKNDKGESSFNLAAHFKDPATAQGAAQTSAEALSRMLKTLDGKLVINMPMATEMMKQVAMAEGYQESDANKLAEQQIKGLAAMGQMFRLTQQQDDNIVTSLQFNGAQVTMNGENMPLDGFLSRYMLGAPAAEGLPE
ncbi:YdgA family protein [Erwinia sp. PK3-005]|uniref:YdgA family protein n=1 Tax=Mixta hanseatica TaxID=2872648 RepID=A0ABY4RGT3_9GAMM|nr:YdgA family protein [Mixta hanseatica]UQY45979.1 YdgA family protein [Mixta hanseatica]